MATEHSQYTSAASSSGCTASSSAGLLSHARSSTSTRPSANASPNHVHDQSKLIGSLALAIGTEKKQLPLPVTVHTLVFRSADITKIIEA